MVLSVHDGESYYKCALKLILEVNELCLVAVTAEYDAKDRGEIE